MFDVLILGGGASGIACALGISPLQPGEKVAVLEAQDDFLIKLKATGNGRCNLGNLEVHAKDFHSSATRLLPGFLKSWTVRDLQRFFRNLALPLTEEEGRLYPYSMRAESVRSALLRGLQQTKIDLFLKTCILSVKQKADGSYRLLSADQQVFETRTLILATGGEVQPSAKEVAGLGLQFARDLGLQLQPTGPALTGILLECPPIPLQGLRCEARLRVYRPGEERRILAEEKGEILFTNYGLSGIPSLSISHAIRPGYWIELQLLPDFSEEEVLGWLERAEQTAVDSGNLLDTFFPQALARYLLSLLPQNGKREDKQVILQLLRHLRFRCAGLRSYDMAQISRGGVDLRQLDGDHFSCRSQPNLYIIGELLDVDGICGGYNLHWAWMTGQLAAKAYRAGKRGKACDD